MYLLNYFIHYLGASDNAVSVAVALEVFETLARGSTLIKHPIIFLFNGAEEKALLVKTNKSDIFCL